MTIFKCDCCVCFHLGILARRFEKPRLRRRIRTSRTRSNYFVETIVFHGRNEIESAGEAMLRERQMNQGELRETETMITVDWPNPLPDESLEGREFSRVIDALRLAQQQIAKAAPPVNALADVADRLEEIARILAPYEAKEARRIAGRRMDLPGRLQALVPPYHLIRADSNSVIARVVFSDFYLGTGGAAHGGAIPLLLDEVMARLAHVGGRAASRTAFIHVNYRALVEIGKLIRIEAKIDREAGRKIFASAQLYRDNTLLADATGLFLLDRISS